MRRSSMARWLLMSRQACQIWLHFHLGRCFLFHPADIYLGSDIASIPSFTTTTERECRVGDHWSAAGLFQEAKPLFFFVKGNPGIQRSNIVGDIIRSYSEINTSPRQVAVHYIMCMVVKVFCPVERSSYSAWRILTTGCSGCYSKTKKVSTPCQNGYVRSQVNLLLLILIGSIEFHG
jgi:hypothetical protein